MVHLYVFHRPRTHPSSLSLSNRSHLNSAAHTVNFHHSPVSVVKDSGAWPGGSSLRWLPWLGQTSAQAAVVWVLTGSGDQIPIGLAHMATDVVLAAGKASVPPQTASLQSCLLEHPPGMAVGSPEPAVREGAGEALFCVTYPQK